MNDDMSDHTADSYRLVCDHMRYLYESFARANRVLDAKSFAAMFLNVALVFIAVALRAIHDWMLFSVVLLAAFSAIFLYTGHQAGHGKSPGRADWDELWRDYLSIGREAAFRQVISDIVEGVRSAQDINERKAMAVQLMASVWMIQISIILASLMFSEG